MAKLETAAVKVECGNSTTEITAKKHRDGSVTVRLPYIRWVRESGNLCFRRVRIPSGVSADTVFRALQAGTTMIGSDGVSVYDYLCVRIKK